MSVTVCGIWRCDNYPSNCYRDFRYRDSFKSGREDVANERKGSSQTARRDLTDSPPHPEHNRFLFSDAGAGALRPIHETPRVPSNRAAARRNNLILILGSGVKYRDEVDNEQSIPNLIFKYLNHISYFSSDWGKIECNLITRIFLSKNILIRREFKGTVYAGWQRVGSCLGQR